jgi:hypothetical protein
MTKINRRAFLHSRLLLFALEGRWILAGGASHRIQAGRE